MDVIQFTAPACWASYLINGDASGLDDAEKASADRCLDAMVAKYGSCYVHDAEDLGFRSYADYGMNGLAEDLGFRSYADYGMNGLAGDVCLYSFLA